jgi:hypothetical protein
MDNIIFIFSLPRSGSTLLQRMLACSSDINTVSEPWLLLSPCYAIKKEGVFTEYNHGWAHSALTDFVDKLPGKEADYFQHVGRMVFSLYNDVTSSDCRYFLDKTPRYYLIVSEIAQMFPRAKFIFLFRNPLQVLASVIHSLNNDSLRLNEYFVDLYRGPELLAEAYRRLKDVSISVCFDDLVKTPIKELERIAGYLEICADDLTLSDFSNVKIEGHMGDKDGYRLMGGIDDSITEKWKQTLGSAYRKRFAEEYIRNLKCDTLKVFGYTQKRLINMIHGIDPCRIDKCRDPLDSFLGKILGLLELSMFISKIRNRNRNRDLFFMHR